MSFANFLHHLTALDFEAKFRSVTDQDIQRAITAQSLKEQDLIALISPLAASHIEAMARKSRDITTSQFGRVMGLYTPMYLSNYCINHCLYCGFNCRNTIPRSQLTAAEVRREAQAIAASGLKHILILTGEAPQKATLTYLIDCCAVLRDFFSSISIEIYPLDTADYQHLIAAGVDGLTIYQETYDANLYAKLHPKGPKRDFNYRLDAPQRGCQAGMRNVNIGSLLGLSENWRKEVFLTGMHAAWLMRKFPEIELGISLPRMRPHQGEFMPGCTVNDLDMVQIMTALRIFLPRCNINISTRENGDFRENILPLGVTKMSAGVSTSVGGHTRDKEQADQFEISDNRSVAEICEMLRSRGVQPLFKDWEQL